MNKTLLVLIVAMVFISGCATVQKKDYSAFYAHRPRSIVVVPALNNTTEINAPLVFASTITAPLAE